MKYEVSLDKYWDSEVDVMAKWCAETFAVDKWKYIGGWPGTMCFVKDVDRMHFVLRWIDK